MKVPHAIQCYVMAVTMYLMQQINGTELKVVGVSAVKTKGRGFIIQTLPILCLGLWKSWLSHGRFLLKGRKKHENPNT